MIISLIRQHPRLSLVIGLLLFLLLVGLILAVFALSRAYAMPPQPLPFRHSAHVQAGVPCTFCHAGVTTGPVAGIPSLAKCMGCHNAVQGRDPRAQADIQRLVEQWKSGKPVQWVKVNDQPDFVRFSHQPHIAAGVACESCHGDVASMGYARAYNLNMGFCLNCHRRQPPDKVARLIDCTICHY